MASEKQKASQRAYYERNKALVKSRAKEWVRKNPEVRQRWYEKNKALLIARAKDWKKRNPDKVKAGSAIYEKKYAKRRSETKKIWRQERKEVYKAQIARRQAKPVNRIRSVITGGVRRFLEGKFKSGKTFDLLAYTPAELCVHLERQFIDGMNWSNYGVKGWHIDHIIPLSKFDIQEYGDDGFKRGWSLPNLRPLWGKDNISKKDQVLFLL